MVSDVSRDNQNVASENRLVGTEGEPTQKRDSKTDQAPGDATQTAAGRV